MPTLFFGKISVRPGPSPRLDDDRRVAAEKRQFAMGVYSLYIVSIYIAATASCVVLCMFARKVSLDLAI